MILKMMKKFLLSLFMLMASMGINAKEACPASSVARETAWTSVSDQCIGTARDKLLAAIDVKYQKLSAEAPLSAPPVVNDNDGAIVTKGKWMDMKKAYFQYTNTMCEIKISGYDLNKKYESRNIAICQLLEAQKHLKFLSAF